MIIDAVVVEENVMESGICIVVHEVGTSYIKVRGASPVSRDHVISGQLNATGNQRLYNKTLSSYFDASVLMIRRHEEA